MVSDGVIIISLKIILNILLNKAIVKNQINFMCRLFQRKTYTIFQNHNKISELKVNSKYS